ncbi:MAG: radical SAM family heme chaperone HemW [Bacteroidales bacterium]
MAGVYIHIPYCKKICSYCDFYKTILPSDHSGFLEALKREAETRRTYLSAETVGTIYFGGGTPSVLRASEFSEIISYLSSFYNLAGDPEITVEVNPDDVNPDYMKELHDTGINRVSIGVQSWNNRELKLLNRRHDAAGAEKAIRDTLAAGFTNIAIDLIYGLPGMKTADWEKNLDKTFQFDINHLSAYHLTIEPGTEFGRMKAKGTLEEPDEEESVNQFSLLIEKAEQAGFIHYEISNFGKEGYFSLHNSNYWKQVNYLGLGPSAHSFNGYSRQWNMKDTAEYIRRIMNDLPCFEIEDLDLRTRFNEYIMTSLRTMWGIDLEYVEQVFDKEGYDYILNMAGKFRQYGLMRHDKKNLVLTDQGKMISDNIIAEFMMTGKD